MDTQKEETIKGYLERTINTSPSFAESKKKDPQTGEFFKRRYYWTVLEKYIRNFFTNELNQRVVLIPGLRGIGKTTLLYDAYHYLHSFKQILKENLVYLDASELKNLGATLNEAIEVYEKIYVDNYLEQKSDPTFFFIDEAHYDSNWPLVAQTLFNRSDVGNKNILVFVSGSSALALNQTPDLIRRSIKDHLFPLSFGEYLLLKKDFHPPKGTSQKIRKALDSGNVDEAYYVLSNCYKELFRKISRHSINIEKEMTEFLAFGASPMSIKIPPSDLSYRWWVEVLDKVTKLDIPSFSKVSGKSSSHLFRLMQFLAESGSGTQSFSSIAGRLDSISSTHVQNMFEALKKACIIFEVSPNIDPLKQTTKSSKYYFMHPTIRAALLWNIGKFKTHLRLNDTNIFGSLFEDAVAATLYRNVSIKSINEIVGLSFDSKKGGCDFILSTASGNIAVECGWGQKTSKQVTNSLKNNKCKFCINVSKNSEVYKKDNVIYVPRELFLFI